jgi:hypothetical protein
MAVPPNPPVTTISPAEMQILVSRAGLVLNPGQVADLVLAWRQIAGMVAAMPRDRGFTDDMALTFRLTPPGPVIAAKPAPAPKERKPAPPAKPAAKRAAKPVAKPKAKAPVKAKPPAKSKPKPAAKAKAPSRKAARKR